MKQPQIQFLSLNCKPVRLTVEQAAWLLGCQPHDMPILMSARLIRPLGNPASNAIKFFATEELLELASDRAWLSRATNAIYERWREKNNRQKTPGLVQSEKDVAEGGI